MVSITARLPQYSGFARDIDALGWECFLEGRIPTSLITLQRTFLRRSESFWKIRTWSSHCVQYFLNITHRQWLYRNARIHFRKIDGMTKDEHMTIIDLVKDMMLVDPANLLPRHRSLLQVDFQRLSEGNGIDRKLWLTKMHSAIAASNAQPHGVILDDDEDDRTDSHSAYTSYAFSNYEKYRQRSGILATKHSNIWPSG
jgi:hypothetical protein